MTPGCDEAPPPPPPRPPSARYDMSQCARSQNGAAASALVACATGPRFSGSKDCRDAALALGRRGRRPGVEAQGRGRRSPSARRLDSFPEIRRRGGERVPAALLGRRRSHVRGGAWLKTRKAGARRPGDKVVGRYDNELRRKRSRCNDLSSRAAVQGAGGGARAAIPPCRGRVVSRTWAFSYRLPASSCLVPFLFFTTSEDPRF